MGAIQLIGQGIGGMSLIMGIFYGMYCAFVKL
jgi:hypothetical protein